MCPLNFYLCKINVLDRAACACGAAAETVEHYLLSCPVDALPRRDMLQSITPFLNYSNMENVSLYSLMLHKSPQLYENNADIFKVLMDDFIKRTTRFNIQ